MGRHLRFWDRVNRRYFLYSSELEEALRESKDEYAAAQAERAADQEGIRQLEEQMRGQQRL